MKRKGEQRVKRKGEPKVKRKGEQKVEVRLVRFTLLAQCSGGLPQSASQASRLSKTLPTHCSFRTLALVALLAHADDVLVADHTLFDRVPVLGDKVVAIDDVNLVPPSGGPDAVVSDTAHMCVPGKAAPTPSPSRATGHCHWPATGWTWPASVTGPGSPAPPSSG